MILSKQINVFFKNIGSTYNASNFFEWFNTAISNKGYYVGFKLKSLDNFDKVWNNIQVAFGKKEINIIEFLSLHGIIMNETAGQYAPISEQFGYPEPNIGIAYLFNEIQGLKASYNKNSSLGNKSVLTLIKDNDFVKAHNSKTGYNYFSNPNNVSNDWGGTKYPFGYSNNTLSRIQEASTPYTGFIQECDFFKFRGRGFIQSTGRANYIPLIVYILNYNGTNTTILKYKYNWKIFYNNNYDKIATISSNQDWDILFKNTDFIIPLQAIFIHNSTSGNYLSIDMNQNVDNIKSDIYNVGLRVNGGRSYATTFSNRVLQMISTLGG
jgi:hypothetical protein